LRSPAYVIDEDEQVDDDWVRCVDYEGVINTSTRYANFTDVGVVPAMWIDLG